ncbi:MAG: O-methyltransferase [Clostridia bacterium]|nr:O-methyltransferase [Clostridia bacterium]MDD4386597.1 O-methyltransferase [Clostridia bacterium]
MKLIVDDNKLDNIKRKAIENYVPILQDDSLKLIEVILHMIKPKKILEIGTAVGYSAAIFAKYLEIDENNKEGSYIKTIERNEKRFKEATENIFTLNLTEYIIPVFADATEYLTNLKEDDTYDVIFIDAAKGQYMVFLNEAKRLIKSGGVIIADNVLFKGRVLGGYNEHRHRTAVTRLREYIDNINDDKTLDSILLNVGDGVAISIVNK